MSRLLPALLFIGFLFPARAATTIDAANHFAYGANFGWLDGRGDVNNGAVIGEYVCSGYFYAANVGWVNLGSGNPTNGIYYQNLAASDFGVNQDGLGNLRGYAWGANVGWLNFEYLGAPKVDLRSGRMTGYIYSANCGWISLSNAIVLVQTDVIANGADSDANGLPDAWERLNFGHIGVDPNADPDSDGLSNKQEYLAGTDPNDLNSKLRITLFTTTPGGTAANLTWQSVMTRSYYLEETLGQDSAGPWFDSGLGLIFSDGLSTARTVVGTNAPILFYRVQARRPLAP